MLSTITNKLLEEPVEYAILVILLTVLLTIAIKQVAGLVKTHKEYRLTLIELANKYKLVDATLETITQIVAPITQIDTPVQTMYDYYITQLQTSNWGDNMKISLQECVYKPSVSRQVHWYSDTFVSYVINGRGNIKVLNIANNGYVYATNNDGTMRKGFFIKIGNISYFLLDTK